MSWVESSRKKNATKNNKRDKTCAVSADLARRRPNYAAKSVIIARIEDGGKIE